MNAESRWAAVAALGQSVWYDNVARPALAGGHLAQLVDRDGVTGGTSNPSIFAKAVLDSARRAARFGVSPTIPRSCTSPESDQSPTRRAR